MKRQQPVFTTLGILCTAAFLSGLALYSWLAGGIAFSPGRLTDYRSPGDAIQGFEAHDEFEGQCRRCHQPLASSQAGLCLQCHVQVKVEMDSRVGTHAVIASVSNCAGCHSDHQGQDFDPIAAALVQFDHSQTSFSLLRHQVDYDAHPLACSACHGQSGSFKASDQNCFACHNRHDQLFMSQHVVSFGRQCIACHDGFDRLARFDHQQAAFPLKGKHTSLLCADCHNKSRLASTQAGGGSTSQEFLLSEISFRQTPQDCQACHSEPDVHRGLYSGDCSQCHTEQSWKPALWNGQPFDHSHSTRFSLARHIVDQQGVPMSCRSCHINSKSFNLQTCIACHSKDTGRPEFMLAHQQRFGPACLDCHDGIDRFSNFEHGSFFPLDGAHAPLECEACHVDRVFAGTPRECSGCHAEPKIHAGFFGLRCQYCHVADAWQPALLRQHNFPVNHGLGSDPGVQKEEYCQTCHASSFTQYSCYGCHEHQPEQVLAVHTKAGISPADLPACAQCHPVGLTSDESSP